MEGLPGCTRVDMLESRLAGVSRKQQRPAACRLERTFFPGPAASTERARFLRLMLLIASYYCSFSAQLAHAQAFLERQQCYEEVPRNILQGVEVSIISKSRKPSSSPT